MPKGNKAIILAAIEDEGVRVEDIPKEREFTSPKDANGSKRYFKKKGFAQFVCPSDNRMWSSAHAWCIIDLKEQRICYRYEQECQRCNSEANPDFSEEEVKWMADLAVKSFLRRTGQLHDDLPDRDNGGPQGGEAHDEQRCQMCKELGRSCWKKY